MKIITETQDLVILIYKETENAPKKYRATLITDMQKYSKKLLSNINTTNSIYVCDKFSKTERRNQQNKCISIIEDLVFTLDMCKLKQIFTNEQKSIIDKKLTIIKKLLYGWIKSDNLRFMNI